MALWYLRVWEAMTWIFYWYHVANTSPFTDYVYNIRMEILHIFIYTYIYIFTCCSDCCLQRLFLERCDVSNPQLSKGKRGGRELPVGSANTPNSTTLRFFLENHWFWFLISPKKTHAPSRETLYIFVHIMYCGILVLYLHAVYNSFPLRCKKVLFWIFRLESIWQAHTSHIVAQVSCGP